MLYKTTNDNKKDIATIIYKGSRGKLAKEKARFE